MLLTVHPIFAVPYCLSMMGLVASSIFFFRTICRVANFELSEKSRNVSASDSRPHRLSLTGFRPIDARLVAILERDQTSHRPTSILELDASFKSQRSVEHHVANKIVGLDMML